MTRAARPRRATGRHRQAAARGGRRRRPAGSWPALGRLDREPGPPPGAHAAVDDMPHLAGAVALQQRRADRRPLAGGADHGDRSLEIDAFRNLVQVVVRRQQRAGDVLGLVLRLLAHVEHLELLPAGVELVDGQSWGALDAPALLAPGGHPTVQVTGHALDPDGGGELDRGARLLVVAPDDHDRLAGLDEPREPGAEPRTQRGDAHRAGEVGLVELELRADVDDERTGRALGL